MSQKRITIRPLRSTDTNHIHELMHMPNVLWSTTELPSTNEDEWTRVVGRWVRDERIHAFVAELQNKVVGLTTLHLGAGRAKHTASIFLAVHDQYQGQGIGKMLMLTIIDLSDNWLNLQRLELDIYTDNERALRLYKNFDFEVEGRKRLSSYRNGSYIDSYLLSRLRPSHTNQQYTENMMQKATTPPEPSGSAEPES